MAKVEVESGQVSVVAERHGISKSYCIIGDRHERPLVRQREPDVRTGGILQSPVEAFEQSSAMPMTTGAVCRRSTGLALVESVAVIEINLPGGVRERVDSGVNNEKALRRVLSAVPGLG